MTPPDLQAVADGLRLGAILAAFIQWFLILLGFIELFGVKDAQSANTFLAAAFVICAFRPLFAIRQLLIDREGEGK